MEAPSKDTGSMGRPVAWVSSARQSTCLTMSMKDFGNKTAKLVCASSVKILALTSRMTLTRLSQLQRLRRKINRMERELRSGPMAATTMVFSGMASKKEKVSTSGLMAQSTQDVGKTMR